MEKSLLWRLPLLCLLAIATYEYAPIPKWADEKQTTRVETSVRHVAGAVAGKQLFAIQPGCDNYCTKQIVEQLEQVLKCGSVRVFQHVGVIEGTCDGITGLSSSQIGELAKAGLPGVAEHYSNIHMAPEPGEKKETGGQKFQALNQRHANQGSGGRNVSVSGISRYGQSVGFENWALDRIDQFSGLGSFDGKFDLGCFPKQGEGVVAYVIDTGCRASHEDLAGRVILRKTSAYESGADDNGHGTHVAGLVAGTKSGVCKRCTIVCVKALAAHGGGDLSDVVEGIEEIIAHHQADSSAPSAVAVLSIGARRDGSEATILDIAVKALAAAGVVPVVASSNYADNACDYTPASAEGAITVGATNIYDELYELSNWGNCLHILAPGESIMSASMGGDQEYESRSGTSMAAPLVAGSVALLLAEDPSLTKDKILEKLHMNAKKIRYQPQKQLYSTFETELLRMSQDDCSSYSLGENSVESPLAISQPPSTVASPSSLMSASPSSSVSASPSSSVSATPSSSVSAAPSSSVSVSPSSSMPASPGSSIAPSPRMGPIIEIAFGTRKPATNSPSPIASLVPKSVPAFTIEWGLREPSPSPTPAPPTTKHGLSIQGSGSTEDREQLAGVVLKLSVAGAGSYCQKVKFTRRYSEGVAPIVLVSLLSTQAHRAEQYFMRHAFASSVNTTAKETMICVDYIGTVSGSIGVSWISWRPRAGETGKHRVSSGVGHSFAGCYNIPQGGSGKISGRMAPRQGLGVVASRISRGASGVWIENAERDEFKVCGRGGSEIAWALPAASRGRKQHGVVGVGLVGGRECSIVGLQGADKMAVVVSLYYESSGLEGMVGDVGSAWVERREKSAFIVCYDGRASTMLRTKDGMEGEGVTATLSWTAAEVSHVA